MIDRDDVRNQALNEIEETLTKRKQDTERLEHLLETFTNRLFSGFEEAIELVHGRGIHNISKARYLNHPIGGWRRVMQIGIDDWRIIMVPMIGMARPNLKDEAMIPGSYFKEPCARVAFFLMQQDDPQTTAFYDAIILLNGSWFAWGYGWPKQQDDAENTNYTNLALDMLSSFVKDIHLRWNARDETTLAEAMDAKRRAYRFGLPGEE